MIINRLAAGAALIAGFLIALPTGSALAAAPASGAASTSGTVSTSGAAPASGRAPTFDASYLGGVSGAKPERTVNLAGTWQFTPLTDTVCTGGGPFGTTTGPMTCVDSTATAKPTTIQVPGGGWLKQGWTNLSRAVYSRTITVPDLHAPQVTKLSFGAINHRATLWVDGREVGTQTTSYTSSVFDLSDFVRPGRTHQIKVLVEGRKALVGPDGRYTVAEGASWSDDVAQGIFRSAGLQVFPAVHVADAVVRTSVHDRTLSYDTTVTNSTAKTQTITLGGRLSSWNGSRWAYPTLPARKVRVPARSTITVNSGPIRWLAGTNSYWYPNVPYRPGYRAQLHNLTLTINNTMSYAVRFGFREIEQAGDHYELNGVRVNFRGDSLQGANYDNIDFHGRGDAYDTFPGFLAGGWPKAVDNYLRLNYSGVRIHQIPATPYMLDVTDELGLMVQDESAIRGSNNRENFITGRDTMVKHVADLVQRDRNHASVLRWSQANEPQVAFFNNPGAGPAFDETLYATVMKHDTTRPISTDGDSADLPQHDNYTVFCHYDGFSFGQYTESVCGGPAGKPHGQGEFIWSADSTPQGMTWFATATMRMREQGASDSRPYTMLSAWSSIIPGVKRTDMRLEINYPQGPYPIYGEDNLPDPWKNPTLKLIQQAFNPVAVIDTGFWNANKMSDTTGRWPTTPSVIQPGATTRTLSLFNDTFTGTQLNVTWKLTATGRTVDHGTFSTRIALGAHKQQPLTFHTPATNQPLHLELEVSKPGQGVLYRDTTTVYAVAS
ncbi:sugar-binding domain-containing protein [Winogradskya humida]|uniref:Beta-galactosidase n=1 Tax=Winogradskya humida TaxID=113566 RepID=A0ABQ4A274_9ACTN|nr:sugar-binding domain-containing protein [Actinoplanes humidus]GIE24943.1 beta-galactosidase [Actinoplanes humidus]